MAGVSEAAAGLSGSITQRLRASPRVAASPALLLLLLCLLQLPILASSVVSLYFLELTDIFQPVHSGYSCNDRSLSLPYIAPKQEVCPLPLLFSLAFAAPTATVSQPAALRDPGPPSGPGGSERVLVCVCADSDRGGHPVLLPVQEVLQRADGGQHQRRRLQLQLLHPQGGALHR